jgi:hypothetical protein
MASSALVHGLLYEHKNLDKNYKLNSPSPTEGGELVVLKKINGYIRNQGHAIDITVGKHTFKNVYGANKVEGTPKADIALVCYDKKTGKFYDACFISHKMGRDASGFQQYSGITPKADGVQRGSISEDKNVVEFLKSLSKLHESVVKGKHRYYTVVEDKNLIGKSIYGPLFGSRNFGVDNIHLIGQGDPVFRKIGKTHRLEFSAHMSLNPDVSEFKKQDYTTIIGARYSSGRNYEVNGKVYQGVRVLIMPQKLIGSKAIKI